MAATGVALTTTLVGLFDPCELAELDWPDNRAGPQLGPPLAGPGAALTSAMMLIRYPLVRR